MTEYKIIPIGDHCAPSMILKELGIRKESYPFDWIMHSEDQLSNSNIYQNIDLVIRLLNDEDISKITDDFLGDAFTNNDKTNTIKKIRFQHDDGSRKEIFEKYFRRFNRLKENIKNHKVIFIFVTRKFLIEKNKLDNFISNTLKFNRENKIVLVSGIEHKYIDDSYYNLVTYKHIDYNIKLFPHFDYSIFRPLIKEFFKFYFKV